jgi:ABC-2 type transport system permease protein
MPVVMMLLFGFAISTDVRNVRTAVVLSYVDHQTHKMVERLGANEYFDILYKVDNSAAAEQLIRHQKADVAIVFGRNKAIQVMTDGADPNMAQMYANYATMILQSSDTSVMTQKLLFNPQMRSCYNFVPGIMGMLLLLVCAMMTSISIVKEKERGTMEVLLVSPIRPLMIIIAKAVPYLVLAFVILCTILSISKYVLLVPISGSLFWIFLVSCIYIIVALSLGLLISTVAKTQLVALLTSAMMLLMPTILLSGMMFPVESMPDILQYIAAIMPPRYYISAMRKLMIMGVGIDKITHELMVLSLMAVVLLSAALLKFRSRLE